MSPRRRPRTERPTSLVTCGDRPVGLRWDFGPDPARRPVAEPTQSLTSSPLACRAGGQPGDCVAAAAPDLGGHLSHLIRPRPADLGEGRRGAFPAARESCEGLESRPGTRTAERPILGTPRVISAPAGRCLCATTGVTLSPGLTLKVMRARPRVPDRFGQEVQDHPPERTTMNRTRTTVVAFLATLAFGTGAVAAGSTAFADDTTDAPCATQQAHVDKATAKWRRFRRSTPRTRPRRSRRPRRPRRSASLTRPPTPRDTAWPHRPADRRRQRPTGAVPVGRRCRRARP